MTPLPSLDGGGGYGGPQAGDSTSPNEQQKLLNTVETSLQDIIIPSPSEEVEWSETPYVLLNEGTAGPSALRARVLRLDLSPTLIQDVFSETSSRWASSNRRDHLNGGQVREPHDVLLSHPLVEDAMDISDSDGRYSDFENHTATMPPPSSMSSWSREQPCRPNPNSNHDMTLFLSSWRHDFEHGNVVAPITEEARRIRDLQRPAMVTDADVASTEVDMQGIDWASLGTNRTEATAIRSRYHQHPMIRQYPIPATASRLPNTQRFFRFQHMNMQHRIWIEHYQLRNLVATTSHNDIHYVSRSKVMSTNHAGTTSYCTMDLRGSTNPPHTSTDFHVTALATAETMLIAGGYRGEYAIQDLTAAYGTEPTTGYVSSNAAAITNHIHTHNGRSSGYPLATFCSNDKYLRTLDCYSNRIVSNIPYADVMNCATTSPNGRLRVLAGDFDGALIVDADSGRILERTSGGSTGHGFACAWADNDIHVATAGQDCQVLVWDARNWSTPLASIACESSYATSLRFSPIGGGSPILIAAETADVVNIIDARNYASKQTIDFFGDMAGTAISNDGSQLIVANGDRHFGGLMIFQREDFGEFENNGGKRGSGKRLDWLRECELEFHPSVRLDAKARRRRGLKLHDLYV